MCLCLIFCFNFCSSSQLTSLLVMASLQQTKDALVFLEEFRRPLSSALISICQQAQEPSRLWVAEPQILPLAWNVWRGLDWKSEGLHPIQLSSVSHKCLQASDPPIPTPKELPALQGESSPYFPGEGVLESSFELGLLSWPSYKYFLCQKAAESFSLMFCYLLTRR